MLWGRTSRADAPNVQVVRPAEVAWHQATGGTRLRSDRLLISGVSEETGESHKK